MKNKKLIFWSIIAIIIIAIVIILSVLFSGSRIKYSGYQAVFLTNGQVYFGQITDTSRQDVKLENIYYLQIDKDLQSSENQASQDADIALIKLGNELHGPQDLMIINREQVLFVENLKENSKVIKAINDYKNK